MENSTFELFLNTTTMMDAEIELIKKGADAIPELQSLFSGASKNRFGVPYRDLGLPLRCALEVAIRLGPISRPLEPYFRNELAKGSDTAARALGSIGVLELDSIVLLAAQLEHGAYDVSMESAVALLRCGCADHAVVLNVIRRSNSAKTVWERSVAFLRAWPSQK